LLEHLTAVQHCAFFLFTLKSASLKNNVAKGEAHKGNKNLELPCREQSQLNCMPKKALRLTQITTLSLAFVLILSCFLGVGRPVNGQSSIFSTQPTGSASAIASLESAVEAHGGWNSSLQTIYDGIALNETTVSQLQNAVDSINITSTYAAETVFYWYFELSKFGVAINATTIEAALNEVTMLPNVGGLPDDYDNTNVSPSVASFLVYFRYDLYAYQWAAQLGYETSKWNLQAAYAVFNNGVNAYGEPVLCVGSDGNGWGIGYGPRYYDECAETIDMYLTFWQLGITGALAQAQFWWNWTNAHLWDGDFYQYAPRTGVFECEAGGFDQIIWKLYYNDQSISDVNNLFTDMETRWLSQGWNSPQWNDYVVQHATDNPQLRLKNTIISWASLLGFYGNMTSSMQSQVQGLLDGTSGPAPAWNLTMQSGLYDNSTGMFRMYSGVSSGVGATADAAVLIMLLSTVPVNGSLAVPLEDCVYEDVNSIIDGGISNVNLANSTVTVSVAKPGTFMSMFGTDIFEYNLNSTGVWKLTFASDWNSITNETLVSPLPTSRIYLGTTPNTENYTISASSDSNSMINPSGLVNVTEGANQTFTYYAANGYAINQVLVDNVPVPITGSYTFIDVNESHTIAVSALPNVILPPNPSPTPTPSPTPSPTPTPTPSPTPLPTPQPSPSPTPSSTPTPTPTPSPTSSSTPAFRSPSVSLPVILGALISLAALLLLILLLPPYIKNRKNTLGIENKQ
jgi:hypothetical protein